jgi:hypothetical protein
MMPEYPDDADGEALRQVASLGSDMSQPMDINFEVAAPDELTANRVAHEAAELGYATSVWFDDAELDLDEGSEGFLWTCTCTRNHGSQILGASRMPGKA